MIPGILSVRWRVSRGRPLRPDCAWYQQYVLSCRTTWRWSLLLKWRRGGVQRSSRLCCLLTVGLIISHIVACLFDSLTAPDNSFQQGWTRVALASPWTCTVRFASVHWWCGYGMCSLDHWADGLSFEILCLCRRVDNYLCGESGPWVLVF
jgi:hypothetical protein